MARVLFCVLVLTSLHQVLARDCSNLENIKSCDECIQCGGSWCTAPISVRCAKITDDWCPENIAALSLNHEDSEMNAPSNLIKPSHVTKILSPGHESNPVTFEFPKQNSDPKVKIRVHNSTLKNSRNEYKGITSCEDNNCMLSIPFEANTNFCPANGKEPVEIVSLGINVEGIDTEASLQFHVQCQCECSKIVEKNSVKCNRRGDYSCGACSCRSGWEGDSCENMVSQRGDIPTCTGHNSKICSGNGICKSDRNGRDGSCQCFEKEGSQYFDENCMDICDTISYFHDLCLEKPVGRCENHSLVIDRLNNSKIGLRDGANRRVWIPCNETVNDCIIQYVALRNDKDEIHVMIVDSCKPVVAPQVAATIDVTIPVVLAVIAVVATAAAVAGYMMWKNRLPPAQGGGWTSMEPDNSTNVNPLYKPPTSSFKNPTYGKL